MLIFNKPQSQSSVEITHQFAPSTMIAALGRNLCFLFIFSYFIISLIIFQPPPSCSVSQTLWTSVFISYCQNRMTTLWTLIFQDLAQALRSPTPDSQFRIYQAFHTAP